MLNFVSLSYSITLNSFVMTTYTCQLIQIAVRENKKVNIQKHNISHLSKQYQAMK